MDALLSPTSLPAEKSCLKFAGVPLAWVGCIAGALEENAYRTKLTAAGFEQIQIEATRICRAEDAREFLSGQGIDVATLAPQVGGKFLSAFLHALKPSDAQKASCGPTCCR